MVRPIDAARAIKGRYAAEQPEGDREENSEGTGRKSQATRLVELADGVELWHDEEQAQFASFEVDGHIESRPVKSKSFKTWLRRRFYEVERKSASTQALNDAIGVLEGKALYDGQRHIVHTRIAGMDGAVYVDLCNESWEALEITTKGWRIVSRPAVRFRRARGMQPLPDPVHGGNIADLRPFVNVATDNDFVLLVAWLVQSMSPKGPYPLLALHGEQGTAKSTTTRVLRQLIDPNKADLRTQPRNERDLMIAAQNSWVLAFDNLSSIPDWLSDALCRLATGGGFSTRELYTDSDEAIFDAQRPAVIDGISELVTRPDLLDRAININLPVIPEGQRMSEKDFWRLFKVARPQILGALFDALLCAMNNESFVRLERLPRMADFAIWVTAAEPAFGWTPGTFMSAYSGNRSESNLTALQASLVAGPIMELVAGESWAGTATELLRELEKIAGESTTRLKNWPKSPSSLSNAIGRIAPNLRAEGFDVDRDSTRNGRRRVVAIRRLPQNAVTAVTNPEDIANQVPETGDGTFPSVVTNELSVVIEGVVDSIVNTGPNQLFGDGDDGDDGDLQDLSVVLDEERF